ncbi:MAG: thiosulfate oxidation carrier complex protein SoxZ [Burkholderiales bacterium]
MANAKIRLPEKAHKGEIIEIRALVQHAMESGFRLDELGRKIPRHIINTFVCTYNGNEIFRATLHPAVAANPYLAFFVVASVSGEIVCTWNDDRGGVVMEKASLVVLE